jgi:GTP-dependent phosphoenolpyruvate carboxykinase
MSIITAWQCISPELTMKCVRKSCISNVVDGTDDDMWWDGSEEEENVRSECEEDEDGDSDIDW